MADYLHVALLDKAPLIVHWIEHQGGIKVWKKDSAPSTGWAWLEARWVTPALTGKGEDFPKPTWQVGEEDFIHITDVKDVGVLYYKEIDRFPVSVQRGPSGLEWKLTDDSSQRIKEEVEHFGEGCWYEFDYPNQEAVIYTTAETIGLEEWKTKNG